MTSGLNIWEYAFYSHSSDILGPDEWGAWDRSFSGQVSRDAWEIVWRSSEEAYGRGFAEHVDSILEGI